MSSRTGRLSSDAGARRIFANGRVILTAGSVPAAVATTAWVEVVGPAVPAAGAVALLGAPLTLTLMRKPQPAERETVTV
ncbi:hypothetical protein ACWDOR_41035 [Streptosporangium canum]|uniref:hypothetical protein n=1 Tax=Streptosporangium canum TaxID=324952 RepID=UPI003787ED5F